MAMTAMGTIWDRTAATLTARAGPLAAIAAAALFLPSALWNGFVAFARPGSPALAALGLVLAVAMVAASIWATLALIALASAPDATPRDAARTATRRLLPMVAVTVAIGLVAALLLVPVGIALRRAGVAVASATTMGTMPVVAPAVLGFVTLYLLVFLIVWVFVGARLTVLAPVVTHERRGLGAIRRSIALTRGLTWRIIGVSVLFVIATLVTVTAVRLVTGVFAGLILDDAPRVAVLVASIAASAVQTALGVVAIVFTAELYLALAGRGATT